MELIQIQSFIAVAELLHFGRAAERLHLSQSAVSQQIRLLEHELGVRLFDRSYKKTALTEAGKVFQKEVQDILQLVSMMKEEVKLAEKGFIGTVRIGFISTAAADIVPTLLERFRKERPKVSVELKHALTNEQISLLERRQIDVGFIRFPCINAGKLITKVVHREPFKLFLPASHPLAAYQKLALTALNDVTFLAYSRQNASGFHDLIMGALTQAGVEPGVVYEATDMYTLLAMVSAGIGVAIAPASVARYGQPDVVVRDLPGMPLSEIAIVYRADLSHPGALAFVNLALAASKKMP